MKQLLTLILSLALVLSLAGCGQSGESAPDPWGLTLSASNVTSTGLTLTFTQSGGSYTGELIYGAPYWIEQETGDGWSELPTIDGEEEHAWTTEAYIVPKDGSQDHQVNWEWLYGQLEAGHYRIGKTVSDHRGPGGSGDAAYYAEFDVPEPPEPIDDPWGLALTASDVTATGLTYTFTQCGGSLLGTLTYGHEYWLEQETEDGWVELEPIQILPDYPDLCCIRENGYTIEEVDWSRSYGEFAPGRYRIGKVVHAPDGSGGHNERVYYAEFEVT